jgi:hypothetical protein
MGWYFIQLITLWPITIFDKNAHILGLDREAAKAAFAGFLAGKNFNANQIEFVNLVVDHLTEHEVLARVRESAAA